MTTPRAAAPETSSVGGVTACTIIALAISVARGVRTSSPIEATTTLTLKEGNSISVWATRPPLHAQEHFLPEWKMIQA